MYICIYVYIYVYIHIYIYMHMYIYINQVHVLLNINKNGIVEIQLRPMIEESVDDM